MNPNQSRISRRTKPSVPAGFDVPDPQHQKMLTSGVEVWNKWRSNNPDIRPKLGYTRLREKDFSDYNFDHTYLPFSILSKCSFKNATFRNADLRGVSLRRADLTQANLEGTNLRHASLAECVVQDAVFTGCEIYGISAWNLEGEPRDQSNMIIKATLEEPGITVDELEVAQFVFLLLTNPKIRGVLETVTSKTVLILGRFTDERKKVLDALRSKLRTKNLVPILFDFDKPDNRDLTETISVLAHMARFVIADITDAKSIPQELQKIVPNLPSLPVQPIILEGQYEYAMFKDFGAYLSVLVPYQYKNIDHLLELLDDKVINPALKRAEEISDRRKAFEQALQSGRSG